MSHRYFFTISPPRHTHTFLLSFSYLQPQKLTNRGMQSQPEAKLSWNKTFIFAPLTFFLLDTLFWHCLYTLKLFLQGEGSGLLRSQSNHQKARTASVWNCPTLRPRELWNLNCFCIWLNEHHLIHTQELPLSSCPLDLWAIQDLVIMANTVIKIWKVLNFYTEWKKG